MLVGSAATGDERPGSDVDLVAIGEPGRWPLELCRRDGILVSVFRQTEGQARARFRDPAQAGSTVPAWREAIVLHDPLGVGAALRDEALAWSWDDLSPACDEWVAAELTAFAEEAQKLAAALERGRPLEAAAQRSQLALGLARPVAARHRLLVPPQSGLWEGVAASLGARWRDAQSRAFGLRGESLAESSRAALELYRLACEDAWDLLDDGQRAVVSLPG